MKPGSSQRTLLVACYFWSLLGLALNWRHSGFVVYESCRLAVELRRHCRFVVTFSTCTMRSVARISPERKVNMSEAHSSFAQSTHLWNGTRSGYRNRQEVRVRPCACHVNTTDTSKTNVGPSREWGRLLLHENQSQLVCLHRALGLFRASHYDICYTQGSEAGVDVTCYLYVHLSEQDCLRLWIKMDRCQESLASQIRLRLCLCTFQAVYNSHKDTNTSFLKSTSIESTKQKTNVFEPSWQPTSAKMNGVGRGARKAAIVLGSGQQVPEINCTYLPTQPPQCPPGYFGELCDKRCHCKNKARCHHETGHCPASCQLGWGEKTCNSRLCHAGFYGVTVHNRNLCNTKCMCSDAGDCHVLNGECVRGLCLNASYGAICAEQLCPRHFIDFPSCTTRCYCANDMVCNPYTGKCPGNLCERGYIAPGCTARKRLSLLGTEMVPVIIQIVAVTLKIAIAMHFRVLPMVF